MPIAYRDKNDVDHSLSQGPVTEDYESPGQVRGHKILNEDGKLPYVRGGDWPNDNSVAGVEQAKVIGAATKERATFRISAELR